MKPYAVRRQRELDQARARLITFLQRVAGPSLTAEEAQTALEKAKAWASAPARALDEYVTEHPNTLTEPSPHCPIQIVRLLQHLEATGHGDAVTQLACPRCHRTGLRLTRLTPQGRCCDWCVARTELRPCARCGKNGHIVTQREEGSICRYCYRRDPLFRKVCAICGRNRQPSIRREDGTFLCSDCNPNKPEHECVHCGETRPANAITEEGPVCKRCYDCPPRLCDVCQQIKPISRKLDGESLTCGDCYRGPKRTCVQCGQVQHAFTRRDGEFYCTSCRQCPWLPCADCGEIRPVKANWPLGPVCDTCYQRRRHHPAECGQCGSLRSLVGRASDGQDICGPCSGSDIDYTCPRCGNPGAIYADDACTQCVAKDRVRDLLSDKDGAVHPQLQPLAEQLSAAHPGSVLTWIGRSEAARLLADLATKRQEINHQLLDELPQDWRTLYIRELLVAATILPKRTEHLARLQLWARKAVADLPPHHAHAVWPFAEWAILRAARRRADKGRYTPGSARMDRRCIQAAIKFMTWLDDNSLTLSELGQEDLDLWLTTHPSQRRELAAFIRWVVARRLASKVTIATTKYGLPTRFMHSDDLNEQLRRCLNDDSLPLEARIIGALTSLYALSKTRITELTTDRFQRDGDDAYLTLKEHPVLLPPRLAVLIERQIARPNHSSVLQQPDNGAPRFLFPGRPPSRPRSSDALHHYMRQHGLLGISARNTAMMEAITDLPPIVVSDLFGIHPKTAYAWSQYAQNSWAEYLEAHADIGPTTQ
ncbi:XRE family transcriptional regulator [Streptomyces sp. NPDC086091]|uniref:XRE family transcriptional regulator n=1 Tax=Streptomyces sp. NPDC086091 TaxID=3365751 RepID=UPI0037F67370